MSVPYTPTSGTSLVDIDFVLLPLGMSANATGGPVTKTSITEGASGKEKRYSYFSQPRREYTVAFGPDYIAEIMGIWVAGLGPRYGFMLQDPSDYKIVGGVCTHIDSTHVQVVKTYTRKDYFTAGVVRSLLRDILIPDPNSMTVYRNASIDTSWSLDLNGVLVTSSPISGGDVITVDTEFFVPVRISDDQFVLMMHVKDMQSIQQIKLVEVLPGDLP